MRDALHRHHVLHRPLHPVHRVNRLLAEMIAGKPGVVIPHAKLLLQRRDVLGARTIPEEARVVGGVHRREVADVAVVNLLVERALRRAVAPAKARADGEVLLLGLGHAFHDGADARRVGGHRLLHEHVLAGGDGGFHVQRAEAGRRCENHHVAAAVEDGLVGVEPDELVLVLDLHAGAEVGVALHVAELGIDLLGVDVGDGVNGGVLVAAQGIHRRLAAATAAADQADANLVAGRCCGGLRAENAGSRDDSAERGDGGSFQELATRGLTGFG